MKKELIKYFLTILFLTPPLFWGGREGLTAQNKTIDSLKLALKNAKHDTTRCDILNQLAERSYQFNPDTAFILNMSCEKLAGKNLQGSASEQLRRKYNKLRATSLNDMGYLAKEKGNIAGALQYYEKSLKISEGLGDKHGTAQSFNNIGSLYSDQGDVQKAYEYYNKSLKIGEETRDKNEIALALNNIGIIYKLQKNFQKALENYFQCLKIVEELGDKTGISHCISNIGEIYYLQGDNVKALEYIGKSLKMEEEAGNKRGIASFCSNIASLYFKQKNYAKATEFSLRSLKVSREIGYPENIRNAARRLYSIYKETGNSKRALEYFEVFIQMRDSVSNEQTKKASIKTQLKYEYEKKSAADSVKNAEAQKVKDAQLAAQTASLKQEKFQRYSLVVGLSLVVCGLLFVINRFRITQKQKKIIEEQKIKVDEAFEKLHEKNKEVMDSIYYARRIQRALITNEKYIERKLNDSRK